MTASPFLTAAELPEARGDCDEGGRMMEGERAVSLPKHVIEEDRQLDEAVSRTSEALARLRWHWTLDEHNEERVSVREYARQVGRSFPAVHSYANGFRISRDRGIPISEAIERARVSAETEAATEAVAEARGVAFSTARQQYSAEVRYSRIVARVLAERNGTSVEEEMPNAVALAGIGRQDEPRVFADRDEFVNLIAALARLVERQPAGEYFPYLSELTFERAKAVRDWLSGLLRQQQPFTTLGGTDLPLEARDGGPRPMRRDGASPVT